MYRAPQFHGEFRRSAPAPLPPAPYEPEPYEIEWYEEEEEPPPRRRRRRRSWRWRLVRWAIVLAVWGAFLGGGALLWFAVDLPRPETALENVRRPSLTLLDRSGLVFASYGDVVGEILHLPDLPPWLPEAAVAVEDRRFWSHWGLDLTGIGRAALVDLRAGHVVQGGSTITQQVAKNLFLSNARTFRRKVQEVLLTLWLEQHFSKSEILEIWLNRVYLGSGAWGVDAAAHLYFGVSARKLNLWQSAVIAGLPRAPSRFSPRVDPEAAAARGREVLAAMAANGAITPEQAQQAAAEIAFPSYGAGGWFADWAAARSEALLPESVDASVHTTLDSRMQASAETHLAALLDGPGTAANVGEGAVVVLDAATGAVRAMVGGRDRRGGGFNRAVLARRQPGSAFKPFVWLAALEKGLHPDDSVLDAPIRVGSWSPANYDGRYRGEVTLEEALAQSLNTVSVRLAQQVGGPAVVADMAHRLGLAGTMPDNLTIALGTADVHPLELAGAYAAICNGGLLVTPTGIESLDVAGKHQDAPAAEAARVLTPEIAAAMQRMLAAVVARGSGRAAALAGRTVIGKTGTTQDYRDAWFIGCTGGTVIGVWLGNDDDKPMQGITGGSLPARLFHEIAADMK
jgi:penicillin-binding protein 1A